MDHSFRPTNPDSEWTTAPRAIIVHDPVPAGAFDALNSARPPEDYLFRDQPDPTRYAEQHAALVATLREHVPAVHLLSELVRDPAIWADSGQSLNQVFTRDSLITLPWAPDAYIPARMRPVQRRPETRTLEAAVQNLGLEELVRLPPEVFLEGGDVVPATRQGRRSLFIGHGPRSSREAATFLQASLIPTYLDEVIAIRLANWRMNLDGGFLPLADDVVVADVESILAIEILDSRGTHPIEFQELLASLGMQLVDVTRDESIYRQACNAVCLGDRRIICYDLCPRVADKLEQHDVMAYCVPGSELVKGRGGPRCMTRPIY